MQKVKLNYHNGALRSKCSEPSTVNCLGGSMDRISWESLCFTVAIFAFLDGSRGPGCSVGCSHIFSSVLNQSLCSMNAIQECLPGHRGNKGEKRKALSEQSSLSLPEYFPQQEVVVA